MHFIDVFCILSVKSLVDILKKIYIYRTFLPEITPKS